VEVLSVRREKAMFRLIRVILVAAMILAVPAAPMAHASRNDHVYDRAMVFKNFADFVCFVTVAGDQVILEDTIQLGTPTGDVVLNCHGQVPSHVTEGTSAIEVICTLFLPGDITVETIGTRVITESGWITLSCRWPGALVGG
jgi:hypothetical protein